MQDGYEFDGLMIHESFITKNFNLHLKKSTGQMTTNDFILYSLNRVVSYHRFLCIHITNFSEFYKRT